MLRLVSWFASFLAASSASAALTTLGGVNAASGQLTGDLDANSNKITNLTTPSASGDAANKSYVDAVASGLDWKQSVRVASTANLTLSGEQTIDGVSVVAGDRVLAKNQNTASQNGIYVCAAGSWSRATDCDADAEVTAGLTVFVSEGTSNANQTYTLTTDDAITVGSTSLTFTQIGSLQLGSSSPANLASSASAGSASVAAKEDHVHSTSGLVVAAGTGLTGQIATVGRKLSGENLSGTATLVASKDVNYVNCGAASGTFTMPAAAGDGSEVVIKRYDTSGDGSNTCTIQRASSDTIETQAGGDGTSVTIANRSALRYVSPMSGKWILLP